MTAFAQAEFYEPALFGLVGLLASFLIKYANPMDDTVGGTLREAFGKHSRTLLLAVLAHVILCVVFYEMDQLNIVSALLCGFENERMLAVVMENVKARQLAKLSGDPPPSKGE